MTYQIKDVVRFRGSNYFIAECSPRTFPFLPSDEGFDVTEASTADYRGFQCHYVIENENLTLLSATLSLEDGEYKKVEKGKGRELFGRTAEPLRTLSQEFSLKGLFQGLRWESDPNYVRYDRVWRVIPFSGGILVGRNKDSQFGSLMAWGYDELWELLFDDGKIMMAEDRTSAIVSFRDWLRRSQSEQTKNTDDTRPVTPHVDRDEIISRLKHCFKADYAFEFRY